MSEMLDFSDPDQPAMTGRFINGPLKGQAARMATSLTRFWLDQGLSQMLGETTKDGRPLMQWQLLIYVPVGWKGGEVNLALAKYWTVDNEVLH